ncbi:tRNA (uracil-5-)-methyltransferase [Orbus hercynius]|uniref:tRNA/tmRNA (uracil-C(5))-methyltransferase n=1 Tax=Orbus hercynius TaxID=593135 RepID=A0A495RAZ3_9GAMM|nr:tRNA (uridine(54)-C5)-methyltransferase TrmA [Orbus hercynius]RKS84653.1 tRNA (uracil-5-)-methyltransferase [Orbus hercynius]
MITKLPEHNYQFLLNQKVAQTQELFSEFNLPSLAVYPSPTRHYRMRVEFRIWHNKDELYHIMSEPKTHKRIEITTFPIASKRINQAMSAIVPLLKWNDILRHKLFQIDYLSTLSEQLIISLLYHRKLDDEWIMQAKQLKSSLAEQGIHAHIIGRASNQKICLDQDYIDEQLCVAGKQYIYRQVENSFTQPNAAINIDMLNWAVNVTKGLSGDLLELYCGNGNFSVALAQNFKHVVATEVAKASVKAAQYNIIANNIDNLKIARLSAEEFTQAMNGIKAFKRLEGINLSTYQFKTILVDPPRSGLDEQTLMMAANYDTVIYISCNPLTLKENLSVLAKTHIISHVAVFDQFPYTNHLEIGMVLSKKH